MKSNNKSLINLVDSPTKSNKSKNYSSFNQSPSKNITLYIYHYDFDADPNQQLQQLEFTVFENILLADVIDLAIHSLNNQNIQQFKKAEAKLYFAKKSNKPNLDYPECDLKLQIKEMNQTRFTLYLPIDVRTSSYEIKLVEPQRNQSIKGDEPVKKKSFCSCFGD